MTEQTCVCCGGPVRVVSGEEGTNCYKSLAAERLAVVEAERDRLLVLVAWKNGSFWRDGGLRVIRMLLGISTATELIAMWKDAVVRGRALVEGAKYE